MSDDRRSLGTFIEAQDFQIDCRIISENLPPYVEPLWDRDMLRSLAMYVKYGIPPGGFLTAVLENDLSAAICRMHATYTAGFLRHLCQYIHTYLPAFCYGSPEIVKKYIDLTDGHMVAAQWHDKLVSEILGDEAILFEDALKDYADKRKKEDV